jgi:DNA helicase-2/ATP-dependent DNA helicase PcrA
MTDVLSAVSVSPCDLAVAVGRPEPTAEQSAVIAAPAGPMLVVAGAGSGKTETIAQRVVYLVANGIACPGDVLGLTFTRKAAGELATRIRTRLRAVAAAGVGDRVALGRIMESQPSIGTYHAFAGDVIAEFGPLVGVEPAATVLTPTSTWQLARDVVRRWDKDLDTDHSPERVTQDVLAVSSALADHLTDLDALDDELERISGAIRAAPPTPRQRSAVHSDLIPVLSSLAERRSVLPLVREFVAAKRAARVLDFADQMQLAAKVVSATGQAGEVLRARYRFVFLDEYQDTGHSQRVILRQLFGDPGGGAARWLGHAVTAVGDPVQSIYGWRGASASNLPHFVGDFPSADGTPAPQRELLTSFRNDRIILDLANAVSESVRRAPVQVGTLKPSESALDGVATAALLPTVDDEDQWLADVLAEIWAAGSPPPTAAVLVRRRAAMAAIAQALRDRGVPVDLVGVGGLIDEPEVADIVAMLRLVADHQAGPAAARILTGARWRLGIADIAALARRARDLSAGRAARRPAARGDLDAVAALRTALAEALGGDEVDEAGLVDALADPGDSAHYSHEGWRRISELRSELHRLRGRLAAPLPELVRDIERTLRLDVETLLTPGGRAHLDAFGEVVADVAGGGAGVVELLDYLAVAAEREDGLAPGDVEVAEGRIQVLTVHAAKGLEWDVVAVPHLSAGVFPSGLNSTWLGEASGLPPALRGDRDDVPGLDWAADADQGDVGRALKAHRARWNDRHLIEERRLFYVALTRARHHVLLSAHHWSATRKEPPGPGDFFTELVDCAPARAGRTAEDAPFDRGGEAGRALITPVVCAAPPPPGLQNPLLASPVTGMWPVDPLGSRRPAVEAAARRVLSAMVPGAPLGDARERDEDEDPDGWLHDAELLLAERAAAAAPPSTVDVSLPAAMSVSALVELAQDPEQLARRIHRPMPHAPSAQARRGTAFHAWLERYFGGEPLLDISELPGAHDLHAADDEQLDALIAAFRNSPWAARTPIAVEVPFVTHVAGLAVRGRIDAVFAEPDGGACVVDWKTGAPPGPDRARAVAIQLTAYRLAWSRLHRLPLGKVQAAFYYVTHGRTVTPTDLLDAASLERLIDESVSKPGPDDGATGATDRVQTAPVQGPAS